MQAFCFKKRVNAIEKGCKGSVSHKETILAPNWSQEINNIPRENQKEVQEAVNVSSSAEISSKNMLNI